MNNAIRKRKERTRSCRHAGCEELPTITVVIRMMDYPPRPGKHVDSTTRSRIFCTRHAEELFERIEDLLDNA